MYSRTEPETNFFADRIIFHYNKEKQEGKNKGGVGKYNKLYFWVGHNSLKS